MRVPQKRILLEFRGKYKLLKQHKMKEKIEETQSTGEKKRQI